MFSKLKNKTTPIISDEELIKKYRFSHDSIYVGDLFTRYTALVYGVSLKYLKNEADAEDMTMSIFEKLLLDLKRFEVQCFSAWLYILVKNQCMMEFRRRTAENKKGELILMDELENVENDKEVHLNNEIPESETLFNNLNLGINTLNESQKRCIELFYIENKSYAEVSKITGLTINLVKSNIQNGKRNLKLYLETKR